MHEFTKLIFTLATCFIIGGGIVASIFKKQDIERNIDNLEPQLDILDLGNKYNVTYTNTDKYIEVDKTGKSTFYITNDKYLRIEYPNSTGISVTDNKFMTIANGCIYSWDIIKQKSGELFEGSYGLEFNITIPTEKSIANTYSFPYSLVGFNYDSKDITATISDKTRMAIGISPPIAYDAVGNVSELSMKIDNTHMYFTFDTKWLETAKYPIVIDPSITFGSAITVDSAKNFISVDVGDIDGDGDNDIVAGDASGTGFYWYENDGTGTSWTEHSIDSIESNPRGVRIGDLNNDGHMDVAMASEANGFFAFFNNGSISNPGWTKDTVETGLSFHAGIQIGDMNGDGWNDIIGWAYSSDDLYWYENDKASGFSTYKVIDGSYNGPYGFDSIDICDIDQDGDNDLSAGNWDGDSVDWYENNGSISNPGFTPHDIATIDRVPFTYCSDIDSDGDVDIMAGCIGTSTVYWYENDGSESFTQRTISSAMAQPYCGWSGDLDKDGDLDAVATSNTGGEFAYFRNNGSISNPGFTKVQIDTFSYPKGIILADLDNDTDLDVVVCGDGSDVVRLYLNQQNPPLIDTPTPANDSIGIGASPTCRAHFTTQNGTALDITWRSNYTGSWATYDTNSSVGNGSNSFVFDEATTSLTKYWWRVYADDGTVNISKTYHFTTTTIISRVWQKTNSGLWFRFENSTSFYKTESGLWFAFENSSSFKKTNSNLWFAFENQTSWTKTKTGTQWFAFSNKSDFKKTNSGLWFAFSNRSAYKKTDSGLWFAFENKSNFYKVGSGTQWFSFENKTSWTKTKTGTQWFAFSNSTAWYKTESGLWFAFSNRSTFKKTNSALWFAFENRSTWQKTNSGYWFAFQAVGKVGAGTQWFRFENVSAWCTACFTYTIDGSNIICDSSCSQNVNKYKWSWEHPTKGTGSTEWSTTQKNYTFNYELEDNFQITLYINGSENNDSHTEFIHTGDNRDCVGAENTYNSDDCINCGYYWWNGSCHNNERPDSWDNYSGVPVTPWKDYIQVGDVNIPTSALIGAVAVLFGLLLLYKYKKRPKQFKVKQLIEMDNDDQRKKSVNIKKR